MIDIGSIATGVGAVGSMLGGLFGGGGSDTDSFDKARESMWWGMDQTSKATQRAMDAYQEAFREANAALTQNLGPYAEGGGKGFNALVSALAPGNMTAVDMVSGLPPGAGADITNFLTSTPWYQGAMAEAQKALQNKLVAQGLGSSGAGAKALGTFLGNYYTQNALAPAMGNYQNYLKNIAGLAGMGQTASTGLGSGLADVAMKTGQLYGSANLTQAQLQNALATGIGSSYMQQAPYDYMNSMRQGNSLGSLVGGIGGVLSQAPWGQIGNALGIGGGTNWSMPGSSVLNGSYSRLV